MKRVIIIRVLTKLIGLLLIVSGWGVAVVQAADTKNVVIMLGNEAPGGCELLGKVKGSSKENEADESSAPYVDRLLKARKNLVAEAKQLGGDTVHVIHSNNTGRYEVPGMEKEIIYIGDVYRCE
ncbi:MAG: DUF4156 domain-containing protein [Nitrosomonas sp.]|nr:MAG: DUF4156 domain-containing protein [Nitrosomonas sp.]